MNDEYKELKAYYSNIDGVTVNSGKGSQGIKLGSMMFVMFYKGQIIAKLAPGRVAEVIECGDGLPHDPGTGRPMKDRVLIPASKKSLWIKYCEESRKYAESPEKR